MRKLFSLLFIVFFVLSSQAQIPLTVLPSGGNKKASVSERIGLTDVTISYDRPGVKGREGKIWGQLIHVGFIDQGFGSAKSAPWRAGANENTFFSFSTDVKIEGQSLPAGKYGFFTIPGEKEWVIIFNKVPDQWGAFKYDDKQDALRVKVNPVKSEKMNERLLYTVNNKGISLLWENLEVPVSITSK